MKIEGVISKDQVERALYDYARIRDKTIMAEVMGKILSGHVRNVAVMNNGSPHLAERKYTIHYVTDEEKAALLP